jgi:hypothetical protein
MRFEHLYFSELIKDAASLSPQRGAACKAAASSEILLREKLALTQGHSVVS